MQRAAGTRPPTPTPGSGPSSLRHERIPGIARRDEVFLDRPGTGPADQIEQAPGLVVRAAGSRAPEGLLADHGSRRLVVAIEVAGGVAQRGIRFRERGAILRKHSP